MLSTTASINIDLQRPSIIVIHAKQFDFPDTQKYTCFPAGSRGASISQILIKRNTHTPSSTVSRMEQKDCTTSCRTEKQMLYLRLWAHPERRFFVFALRRKCLRSLETLSVPSQLCILVTAPNCKPVRSMSLFVRPKSAETNPRIIIR